MPNWTSCVLEAPSDVLKKYIGKDEDENLIFDFNKIIPMPEVYSDPELVAGGDEFNSIYWYLSRKGEIDVHDLFEKYPKIFAKAYGFFVPAEREKYERNSDLYYRVGKKYVDAFNKYGYIDWYDWRRMNWGTKWNACDTFIEDSENPERVVFDTAWCMPVHIVNKILEDNPGCEITFTWFDEDYDGTHTIYRNSEGEISETTEW